MKTASACKNIPDRPETNFVHPEATGDFILKGDRPAASALDESPVVSVHRAVLEKGTTFGATKF